MSEQQGEEVLAEIEDVTDGETLEDTRLYDIDAGVYRVAEDLTPRWFFQELGDPAVLAGYHDAVLQGVWDVHEGEGHCRIPLAMERDHFREVDVRQRVAGDDEERAVEIGAELPHRSAGA